MLECLVYGRRAALACLNEPRPASRTTALSGTDDPPVTPELRESLWRDAGLVRERAGLARLVDSPHLLTSLVARSALAREESRGGHFRADFPQEDPGLVRLHTVLRPGHEPGLEQWS
jgi:L-aspartate oxidase